VFGSAIAALLPGCSGSDDPQPTGGAGSSAQAGMSGSSAGMTAAAGSSATGVGDATKGMAVWTQQACNSCHGPAGAGDYGPNITFSTTAGIGAWTQAQFNAAVRTGVDTDGTMLCLSMTRFPSISDASMADLFAYLKAQPINDTKNPGTFCP